MTGLSISSSGIAVAQIVRDDSRTPVLKACQFVATDEAGRAEALGKLIDDLGLTGSQCVNVLQPDTHSLLLIEAPDVQPAELKAAVRWRIKDLINFHIDDAVIDVFEVPDQGAPGRARLMYAVAARAAQIGEQVELVNDSELNLDVVDIPELALRNISALLDEDIRGMAMLYFTDEGGVITLTHQGALYLSRNLDVGMRDLAVADEAMRMAALDKVVLEVQRSLDYYESHFGQGGISQLVIAPLSSEVTGMIPHFSANLGVAVSMLDLNNILECEQALDASLQSRCFTAIGAALRTEQKSL